MTIILVKSIEQERSGRPECGANPTISCPGPVRPHFIDVDSENDPEPIRNGWLQP
jgi:hypothetical protein